MDHLITKTDLVQSMQGIELRMGATTHIAFVAAAAAKFSASGNPRAQDLVYRLQNWKDL